jgi:hypothetical protein
MHVYNAAMEGSGGSDGPRGLHATQEQQSRENNTERQSISCQDHLHL